VSHSGCWVVTSRLKASGRERGRKEERWRKKIGEMRQERGRGGKREEGGRDHG